MQRIRAGIRQLVAARFFDDDLILEPQVEVGHGGLFGPKSAAWTIHNDPSMLIGGLSALLMKNLHPRFASTNDYRVDPWNALRDNSEFIATMTYGSTKHADAAIAARILEHRPTGPGDRFDVLTWIHICETWASWRAYLAYSVDRSPPDWGDRYVAEMASIARRLGIPDPPMTMAALDDRFAETLPILEAGFLARRATSSLLEAPTPISAKGPYALVTRAAVGLLPEWTTDMLRVQVSRLADPWLVMTAARRMLDTVGWVSGLETAAVQSLL